MIDKLPDGSFEMKFTTAPDRVVPHLDPVGDMGNFAFAVYQMPPGKAYMAEGTTCSWADWIKTWSEITGVPASYRQITTEEMIDMTPDRDCGIEVAYMFSYSTDPGYDGGEVLLTAADIRKASSRANLKTSSTPVDTIVQSGIECPMTSWKEWANRYDWSAILSKGS